MFEEIKTCETCGTEKFTPVQQATLALVTTVISIGAGWLARGSFTAAVNHVASSRAASMLDETV